MTDLIKESIADAKAIKQAAYDNAKRALEEAFQPTLQRIISTRIAEEEEFEDDMDMEQPQMDVPAPAPAEPAPTPAATEPVATEPATSPTPQSDVVLPPAQPEEDDLELESILRELEQELDEANYMDDMDEEEDMMEGMDSMDMDEEEDMMEAMDSMDMDEEEDMMEGMDSMDMDEGDEEWDPFDPDRDLYDSKKRSSEEGDMLEQLIQELENEGMGNVKDEKYTTRKESRTPRRSSTLRKQNTILRKELKEAYYAISVLKAHMNEVKVLNTKLRYATEVLKKYDLTQRQQSRVLESFDRAENLKEVKMVYNVLKANLDTTNRTKPTTKAPVQENKARRYSKPQPNTVKGKLNENRLPFASRWQTLANI